MHEQRFLDARYSHRYTNTPDRHFVIALLDGMLFVSACSGRGFKFAPALAESIADLVTGGKVRQRLDLFAPPR